MLTELRCFEEDDLAELSGKIENELEHIWAEVHPKAISLIFQLLEKPEKRLDFDEIVKYP
jgi:hypothetical protein